MTVVVRPKDAGKRQGNFVKSKVLTAENMKPVV
jgi:hypothetical protein